MARFSVRSIAWSSLVGLLLSSGAWGADKPPLVEFLSPREGATVHGAIPVSVTVNPSDKVAFVDIYIQEPGAKDRYSWKEFGEPPYAWGGSGHKLDTRLFADGQASAVVYCYAGGPKPVAEKRVHFIIDNGKPVVRIVAPADLSTVDGAFPVRVETAVPKGGGSGTGIAVSVLVDGALVGTLAAPPFETTVDTCLMSPGLHLIRVIAEDGNGLTGSDSVMVTRRAGTGLLPGRSK